MQPNNMDSPPTKRRRSINVTDSSITAQEEASSPVTPYSCPYDVFLSFRGVDTRNNFTGHLHTNLVRKGIKTFIDDEELRKGEEIPSALLKAIEGSKISVIIFSENYASSTWCLDELVKILQRKELKQQLVWPVFYMVDPSDVRYQKGKFHEAFVKHELRFKDNMDKVQTWRTALRDAANLSGWTYFLDGHEAKFVHKIVEEISAQVIKRTYLNVAKHPVGVEARVEDVLEILDVGESNVRMVGIWGVGGIGKTTIAKAVYNSIAHKFDGCCFLGNVGEVSIPYGGLVQLQNLLLHEILGGEKLEMTNVNRGISVIKERLRHKRVLLVLDDVNQLNQLDNLAGASDWFGCGSRVIITTRDRHLLIAHQVYPIYKARALDDHEACKLLSLNAFKESINQDEYVKFPIGAAIRYAHGLPLAINVLGTHFCGRSVYQWQAALDTFKTFPNKEIHDVLMTSYNALEYPLREAFLHIACFFNHRSESYVIQVLEACDHLNPQYAIQVLQEKALIDTDEHGQIWMHNLIEDMGKEIVRQESPNDPGARSRLWFHEDIKCILSEKKGTKKVRGIRVELPTSDEIRLNAKCFKKMKNLQLFININGRFSGAVDYLPNQLRVLDWPQCPLQCFPSDFNPQKLVELNISHSPISRIGQEFKSLQNLKSLLFENCKFLTEFPDFTGILPNLESLNITDCTSLVEFPRIVNLKSLRDINFRGCKRLAHFPEIVGKLESLTSMNVCGTAIKELPWSIGYDVINLQHLYLTGCENLTNLPRSIYRLHRLERLILPSCRKLVTFPNKVNCSEVLPTSSSSNNGGSSSEAERDDDQGNLALPSLYSFDARGCKLSDSDFLVTLGCASTLRRLDLTANKFVHLCVCISKFVNLEYLSLKGCDRLREIPELPPNLKRLDASDCVSLVRISKLSNILRRTESQMIESMDLTNCGRLCDNLVRDAEEIGLLVNDQVELYVFSLFLSSQHSKFEIVYPGSKVPKWFSCQMDFKRHLLFEYYILVLPNFKWDNTGLALCVIIPKLHNRHVYCGWEFKIEINEVQVLLDSESFDVTESTRVWLHYIPFNTIDMRQFGNTPLRQPFHCRVSIRQQSPEPDEDAIPFKCCGVHLGMPPKEDSCMKLYHAQNLEDGQEFYQDDDETQYYVF